MEKAKFLLEALDDIIGQLTRGWCKHPGSLDVNGNYRDQFSPEVAKVCLAVAMNRTTKRLEFMSSEKLDLCRLVIRQFSDKTILATQDTTVLVDFNDNCETVDPIIEVLEKAKRSLLLI